MKTRKHTFNLVTALLAFVTLLFINMQEVEGKTDIPFTDGAELQEGNNRMLQEMEEFLYGQKGIMEQVSNELLKNGYRTRTALAFFSKDDIQLKFILVDKEATKSEQEKVKSIFFELVEKNNLDPKAFSVKVGDENDGPDW